MTLPPTSAVPSQPAIRVGTSGWDYDHWVGRFYPIALPRARRLWFYQQTFDTVELNASFYHMPRAARCLAWRRASPEGFLWSVKAHRLITHRGRLERLEPLETFLEAVDALGPHLGVVLFQLPPTLRFREATVAQFLAWLPSGGRYAIEPRHPSWFAPPALTLLAEHRVSLVISESGGHWPSAQVLTADFVYVRFHGSPRLYASRYSRAELRRWAAKLLGWNRPAFVYFNNDFAGYAVANALELKRLLQSAVGGRRGRASRQRPQRVR